MAELYTPTSSIFQAKALRTGKGVVKRKCRSREMKKMSSAVSSAESSSMENRVMKIIISSFSARNTLNTWGNSCTCCQVAEYLVEEKAEHQHEEDARDRKRG